MKWGLSRVAAKNRVKALEEKGIITGYKAIINTTASDTGIKYLLIIEAEPDKFYDVIGDLAHFKSNRQIYTGTGEARIIVIGYAKDSKTLAGYMDEMYRKLKGVRKIACQQLMVTHKDTDRGIAYERGNVISEN